MSTTDREKLRVALRRYFYAESDLREAENDGSDTHNPARNYEFWGDNLIDVMKECRATAVACGTRVLKLAKYNSFDVLHIEDVVVFTDAEMEVGK